MMDKLMEAVGLAVAEAILSRLERTGAIKVNETDLAVRILAEATSASESRDIARESQPFAAKYFEAAMNVKGEKPKPAPTPKPTPGEMLDALLGGGPTPGCDCEACLKKLAKMPAPVC